ncbi:MAG: hypothetical protein JWR21_4368 [Herminiimonas sp.]|nr:hypothetical protein [Herminiimonas sp.]
MWLAPHHLQHPLGRPDDLVAAAGVLQEIGGDQIIVESFLRLTAVRASSVVSYGSRRRCCSRLRQGRSPASYTTSFCFLVINGFVGLLLLNTLVGVEKPKRRFEYSDVSGADESTFTVRIDNVEAFGGQLTTAVKDVEDVVKVP